MPSGLSHFPTWKNCELSIRLPPWASPFFSCWLLWVWHRPMRCLIKPPMALSYLDPFQPILLRLCHCEATSPFIWILWISTLPIFGWNLDSTVAFFQPSSPTSLALVVFCENSSEQVQFWTGPEETGQELYWQREGWELLENWEWGVLFFFFLFNIFLY